MTVTHLPLPVRWREVQTPRRVELYKRISEVLDSWIGTPYAAGQMAKGHAIDCVRFVAAVLDELNYRKQQKLDYLRLPSDIGMHNKREAIRGLKMFRRAYEPNEMVRDFSLEPGDVLMTGPLNGGPTHAEFVGTRRNTFYHATIDGVTVTGLLKPIGTQFSILRPMNKEEWIK